MNENIEPCPFCDGEAKLFIKCKGNTVLQSGVNVQNAMQEQRDTVRKIILKASI